MKISKFTKLLIIILLAWLILAIIFGIYDLNISIAIVDENSSWGNFGADFGEAPGYALIAIALATFIGGYIKNIKKQKIIAFLATITGIIMLLLGIFDDKIRRIGTGLCLILSSIIYIGLTWNRDWKNYRKISGIISLLAITFPLLLVQIIKLFWGRVRFRDLAPGYVDFTAWFIPRGITGNHSFPSGHAAMGWMFLPLLVTVKDRKINDPIRIILSVLIIGWGLFVGISRIIVGAHYASDVLFSTGIACSITFKSNPLLNQIIKTFYHFFKDIKKNLYIV